MTRFGFAILALGALLVACSNLEDSAPSAEVEAAATAKEVWTQPLFAGLGHVTFPISTSSSAAQNYFNQGLALAFAFNHAAADVAFNEATLNDPDCAMCYWGSALVLGPNVNAGMDAANAPRAFALAQKAKALAGSVSDKERALINALLTRYEASEPDEAGRERLNRAYRAAMREVLKTYPRDTDILALGAEAMMDVHPWDFWETDGEIRPWTKEITDTLERALELEPVHVGAIHLYIHAVEQSNTPERAELYADTLADLAPAAGHLVHMPAHIYMRVGRYHDSTLTNERAAVADDAFIQACRSNSPIYLAGYIPHNWHFGWVTAAIEGWQSKAYEMAEGTAAALSPELIRAPGMGIAQHFLMQPTFAQLRFSDWDQILATPEPDADLPYARAIWHYAQGQAQAGRGDLDAARAQLEALRTLRATPELENMAFFNRDTAPLLLEVAETVLAGVIQTKSGNLDVALRTLTRGVALEDSIPYNEPPEWFFPVRHLLAEVQLATGDAAGAEATYRADLGIMPENGWALRGLANALQAQEKADEAEAVLDRFAEAWQHADVEIDSSTI